MSVGEDSCWWTDPARPQDCGWKGLHGQHTVTLHGELRYPGGVWLNQVRPWKAGCEIPCQGDSPEWNVGSL